MTLVNNKDSVLRTEISMMDDICFYVLVELAREFALCKISGNVFTGLRFLADYV